jgi:hypothetical protein
MEHPMKQQILLTVAAAIAMACSDGGPSAPRAPQNASPGATATGALIELAGIVEVTGTELNAVYLRSGSELYHLEGPLASTVARVPGADVRLRGSFEGGARLWVQDFRVLAIKGRAVIDGVVQVMDGGIAIQLADGAMILLDDCPEELVQHVGARIWFAVRTENVPAAFGIIAE